MQTQTNAVRVARGFLENRELQALRSLVARLRRMSASLLLCSLSVGAGPVLAETICGNQNCQPETKHGTEFYQTDGNGHYWEWSKVKESDYDAVVGEACRNWSSYESALYGKNFSFSQCTAVLPILDSNAGGSTGSLTVSGLYEERNSSGTLLVSQWDQRGLLSIGCVDAANPDLQSIGTNAQCYCRAPRQWDPSRNTCISVLDIWKDAGVCLECGNPIAPLLGAKIQREDTGVFIGKETLSLAYDTRLTVPYATAGTAVNGHAGLASVPAPAFGANWTSSAHKSIYIQRASISSVGFAVHAYRGDGRVLAFTHPTANSYLAANPAVKDRLEPVLDGSGNQTTQVRLIDAAGNVEVYDMYNLNASTKADLLSTSYVDGGGINYTYDTSPGSVVRYATLLSKMTDHHGRTVTFNYEPSGVAYRPRVKSVVGPDGVISFAYNAANQLSQMTWPDGKVRQYLYERSDLPWALTGIVDENNSRLSTYSYDSEGRAISTEHAGGVERYAVTYGVPPTLNVTETFADPVLTRVHQWNAPQNVSLQLPNGTSRSLGVIDSNGSPFLAGQTQPAGSGSTASSSSLTYDVKGNVLSQDDFQGVRTCYAYDASNRQITRVEGLSNSDSCDSVVQDGATLPLGARRIATQWHPDWRLPTKVVQPLRVTTTVYNGLPDPFAANATASCTSAPVRPDGKPLPLVCRQVQQAMLPTGAVDSATARAMAYGYDSLGQLLSSVDPNGRGSTYAYYTNTTFTGGLDPFLDQVSLLLQGNGPNGSAVITDNSANRYSPTLVGAPVVSTSQSKFGGASISFGGSGDALSYANASGLNLATGDFTVEAWININSLATNRTILQKDQSYGTTFPSYSMVVSSAGALDCFVGTGNNASYPQHFMSPNGLIGTGNWYHVACTRQGTTLRAFVNGALVKTLSQTGTPADGGKPLLVGTYPGGGGAEDSWMSGYIDDLRITKGIARYTANFTPPAQEFPSTGPDFNATGHATGDLQSTTNAAGQTTQFDLYDRAGRVRQMTDPKGIVTQTTYTPRGWVSTTTVTPPGATPRVTSYTYDNVGQVKSVATPDGMSLNYTYDAAHRLVGVTDSKGNSVTYTLDNAGNRLAENVKDTSGTLQRTVTRTFDALNRLQQITGARM